MPDLKLDEITLHYEIDGTGPPVVLLAGMLSDSASWGPLVEPLAAHFTVIRPDNRTTGRTTPWDSPVTISTCADDAAALLRHLDPGPTHIIGHSMGGLMACELSGRHPDIARSLTVLASAPLRPHRTMAMFESLLAIRAAPQGEENWLRALYPWAFRPDFFKNPANVETALAAALAYPHAQSLDAMRLQMQMLDNHKPSVHLTSLDLPAQVILAEHDLMIPEIPAREAWKMIPGVEQHTLADAGHSLHWDNPEGLIALVEPFLHRHAGA